MDPLDKVLEGINTEIRPLLDKNQFDEPPGYNCCGCSTYYTIVEDIEALIKRIRDGA